MEINEIRRTNLRKLVAKYEGMNALARQLGLARGAYISQLLMANPSRKISEKTARSWERTLSLPAGWLDGAANNRITGPVTINATLLSQAIESVMEGLRVAGVKLPPSRLADLIAMQYNDAVPTGKIDLGRLNVILALLKP